MRLLPYRRKDAETIVSWMKEERKHAMWCANLLPYPLTAENFHDTLVRYQNDRNQLHFTAVTDDGEPVGFFFVIPDYGSGQAFMGFVIVDDSRRGHGYGREMIRLAFEYCAVILKMKSAALRVYDNNEAAYRMYIAAGMKAREHIPDVFSYKDEKWGVYVMEKKF